MKRYGQTFGGIRTLRSRTLEKFLDGRDTDMPQKGVQELLWGRVTEVGLDFGASVGSSQSTVGVGV